MKTINKLLGALLLVAAFGSQLFGQTASPSTLAFPAGIVGTAEATETTTFTNTSAVTITGFTMTAAGTNSGDFSFSASPVSPNVTACATSIAPGAACSITVTFTPGGLGARSAALGITWTGTAASPATVFLTGTGGLGGALSSQPVIPAAATLAPTCAQSGSMILMGATTGEVITLPVPCQGAWFDVTVTVTNTSNYNEIKTDSSSTFLLGSVEHSATGIAPLTFWADGSTIQAIKMDGAHLGGLKGSHFVLTAISATQWEIFGENEGTATMTTAFTATP